MRVPPSRADRSTATVGETETSAVGLSGVSRCDTGERRDLSAARRAAFVVPPAGRNEVWQLDFTEWETTMGGTWRVAGCTDYWAKAELGWHVSMTQNHDDAIAAIDLAVEDAERLLGCTLAEDLTDPSTGEIRPIA